MSRSGFTIGGQMTQDAAMGRAASSLRSVVIVSPHFPPSTLAGVHRARHLAQHLPAHGWDPIIVRVDERFYPEPDDPALAALLRPDLKQVRVKALPTTAMRRIGLGDIGLRAYRSLGNAAVEAARRHGAEAVMITGSPFYPTLLAASIKRRTGLPVLLDFQDPWVVPGAAERPLLSKGRAAHELSRLLEPFAVNAADFITFVSDTQKAELAARYPKLDASRMAGIPIGGDPADFDALRRAPPEQTFALGADHINFSYVGTFLPRSTPLMRTVIQGLRRLRDDRPQLAERIRLNFVGTSNQVGDVGEPLVLPLAEDAGVADLVRERPGRVRFLEALSILARSDGLMMIGSDEPHYTASKIYPNLMAKRPYLSLFHEMSSAHRILTEAAGGMTFSFEALDELPQLVPAIAEAFARIASEPETFAPADPATYAAYTADSVAARYAEIFDRISR